MDFDLNAPNGRFKPGRRRNPKRGSGFRISPDSAGGTHSRPWASAGRDVTCPDCAKSGIYNISFREGAQRNTQPKPVTSSGDHASGRGPEGSTLISMLVAGIALVVVGAIVIMALV